MLLAYGFDLLPDATRVRCDGIAVLLKDRFLLFQDGKQILSLPLKQVKEFIFRQGIGCVFTEYKDQSDTEHLLCRADMQHLNAFAAVIKEMNRHLEGKDIHYEYEAELDRVCPKCGRPYRPGSSICDFCVDKKSYIKRLWDVAHPYRWLIYASVAMYFFVQ